MRIRRFKQHRGFGDVFVSLTFLTGSETAVIIVTVIFVHGSKKVMFADVMSVFDSLTYSKVSYSVLVWGGSFLYLALFIGIVF